jgi:hypothetical protein
VPRAAVRLDYFRVDRSGPTKRLLIVAGILISGGMFLIGAHLVSRLDAGSSHTITLVGGLMLATGLILGFGAMAMMLFENVYLQIKNEGLLMHENGKETTLSWNEIESVDQDKAFLVFKRASGDPLRWFAGTDAADVRTKVEEARRKAAHGLLKIETS